MKKIIITNTKSLKELQLNDDQINYILEKVRLVSTKQLSTIINKTPAALRKARQGGYGFPFFRDKDGKIFYNLPTVLKQIGIDNIERL